METKIWTDVFVLLLAEPRHGLWAAELSLPSKDSSTRKTLRVGGCLPRAAAHTLLTVAFLAASHRITNKVRAAILDHTGQEKVRVRVLTEDADFVANFDRATRAQKPLRASKNFASQLGRYLSRASHKFFVIALDDAKNRTNLSALKSWANNTILSPAKADELSRLVSGSTVSQE
jgi:hypothetical protein